MLGTYCSSSGQICSYSACILMLHSSWALPLLSMNTLSRPVCTSLLSQLQTCSLVSERPSKPLTAPLRLLSSLPETVWLILLPPALLKHLLHRGHAARLLNNRLPANNAPRQGCLWRQRRRWPHRTSWRRSCLLCRLPLLLLQQLLGCWLLPSFRTACRRSQGRQ